MGGTKLAPAGTLPLAELAESWLRSLAGERKSGQTLRSYRAAVAAFLADHPGWSPATARLRYAALRQLGHWLAEEGEADTDPLAGMRPPKLDKVVVPRLSDAEVAALLRACKGPSFTDRRDEALVRLMTEGLLRSAEALALTVDDVDLRRGVAVVRRGKGGKGRVVPFGPETGRALDRYLRLRRRHPLADTPPLWLPGAGRPAFAYPGLSFALGQRARAAGIEGFTPHRLRHTGASRWLAAGGTPTGLLQVGGWSSMDMVVRYAESDAAERAVEEARKLGLGQFD